MFVTRKSYDAVVRERDEALALVAKLRRGCETRAAIDAAIISGRDSTIKELEEELRQACGAIETITNRKNRDLDVMGEQLAQVRRDRDQLCGQLSRAYVHDARGRIARHPLNTGEKVKA